MDNKKITLAARIAFAVYIMVLCWLCFGTFDSLPSVTKTFFGIESDKIVHFLMFFPFPGLMFFSVGKTPSGRLKLGGLLVLCLLCGCMAGGVTELIQKFTPSRCPDFADFFADVIGCTTCIITVTVFLLVRNEKA